MAFPSSQGRTASVLIREFVAFSQFLLQAGYFKAYGPYPEFGNFLPEPGKVAMPGSLFRVVGQRVKTLASAARSAAIASGLLQYADAEPVVRRLEEACHALIRRHFEEARLRCYGGEPFDAVSPIAGQLPPGTLSEADRVVRDVQVAREGLERLADDVDAYARVGTQAQKQPTAPAANPPVTRRPRDRWRKLREYVATHLKKGGRTIMNEVLDRGGSCPLKDLAALLEWGKQFDDAWESAKRRVNKKIATVGWRIDRVDSEARLIELPRTNRTKAGQAKRRKMT